MDSKEITLAVRQEKVLAIIKQCHLFLTKDQDSVWDISQLIGKLCYSAIAAFPASLHFKFNTKDHRKENLFVTGIEGETAMVDSQSQTIVVRNGSSFLMTMLGLSKVKSLLTLKPQMLIGSDASMKSLGVFCWENETGSMAKPRKRIKETYQCTRIESSKVCHIDIYKNVSRCESSSLTNGQHGGTFLHQKDGVKHNQVLSGLTK